VFAEGGRLAATTTGDLLFSRAFAELTTTGSAEAVRSLSEASSALARGELMQRADAWSADVAPERYLERCRLKTASLFCASCRLGALFGGRPALADPLCRFGEGIGLAFQVLDDVLDVSGPEQRTGKPRGTDLLDGTVTLPLILARRRDRDLAELDRELTPEQAEAICDRIAATGALDEAREQALAHVATAKRSLATLDLPRGRREALELVADGVVERYA
jgi:geranylgeranyl pyrophosphate synthase